MTRILKYLGIAAAMTLILACFLPWVNIHGNLTVKGVDTTGTNFGKPGYLHLIFALFFLAFTLIQRLWAKRFNLLVIVFNIAWAIRNYLVISRCEGGECPQKEIGLYLVLICSVIMTFSALFPAMELREEK